MDNLIHRCPFLTVIPSTVLHSAGQSSLVGCALKCPVMMELASTPRVRELSSSASLTSDTSPKNPGQLHFKEDTRILFIHQTWFRFFIFTVMCKVNSSFAFMNKHLSLSSISTNFIEIVSSLLTFHP